MPSQRSKVQLAPPTGKICDIQDGLANSDICVYLLRYKHKYRKI